MIVLLILDKQMILQAVAYMKRESNWRGQDICGNDGGHFSKSGCGAPESLLEKK